MSDILKDLKLEFASFNRNLTKLKNFYEKLKQKKSITEEEKNIFTVQMGGLKADEAKLKLTFSNSKEKLTNDMSKITYEKIVKDYENLSAVFAKISLEFHSLPVSAASSSSASSAYNVSGNMNNFSGSGFEGDSDRHLAQKGGMFIEVRDVDEEIVKEREAEIKNIHKDITMLNDMYK